MAYYLIHPMYPDILNISHVLLLDTISANKQGDYTIITVSIQLKQLINFI